MLSFTLDWNCVIAIEKNEPARSGVVDLADAHRRHHADVALLATSASESLRDCTFPGDYGLFEKRVKDAGLGDLPVLQTPAIWDLTFWDRSYRVDLAEYNAVKPAIWAVLFPRIEENPGVQLGSKEFSKIVHTPKMKNWRNAWCDVHSLITHLHHRRDVFVTTNTRDFQRNSDRLQAFGVKRIVTPAEARQLI